jgi:hypothetical protein
VLVSGFSETYIRSGPGLKAKPQRLPQLLKLELRDFPVSRDCDLACAFAEMSRSRAGAVLIMPDTLVLEPSLAQITSLAARYRLPTMNYLRLFAETGGFMSYGAGRAHHIQTVGGLRGRDPQCSSKEPWLARRGAKRDSSAGPPGDEGDLGETLWQ